MDCMDTQLVEFYKLNPDADLDGYHAVFYHDSDCPILNGGECRCHPTLSMLSQEEYDNAEVSDAG